MKGGAFMILSKEYNRERAVEYARRWARERNPLFIDFTGRGGDCTSFVSQAILAGSCAPNFDQPFGWYYISPENRAPAWSGVEFFYNFFHDISEKMIPYNEKITLIPLIPQYIIEIIFNHFYPKRLTIFAVRYIIN